MILPLDVRYVPQATHMELIHLFDVATIDIHPLRNHTSAMSQQHATILVARVMPWLLHKRFLRGPNAALACPSLVMPNRQRCRWWTGRYIM